MTARPGPYPASASRPEGSSGPTAGVILAGGRSSRLGQDKARLTLGTAQPLLLATINSLRSLVDEVIVVGDATRLGDLCDAETRVVPDEGAGWGMLGGILSGLDAADCPHAVVVGCDMPFLDLNLLRYLVSLPRDYDVLIPRWGTDRIEPLHAIYSRSISGVIRRRLARGCLRADAYFGEVRVRYVEETALRERDPDLRSFFNINTPADLDLARVWASAVAARTARIAAGGSGDW